MARGSAVALTSGRDRVVVEPALGGRLASLFAGGRERLLDAAAGERDGPTLWGCFLMAPWPGRIAGARLRWNGRETALAPNLGRHAIHGVGFDRPWQVRAADERAVEMSCALDWPLGGTARQRVSLAPGRLELSAEVRAGKEAMPAALGWHPWFRRPAAGDCAVRVDADDVLETDDELIPTGLRVPVAGDTDLRDGPALGGRRLDHVYVEAHGPAVVAWPDWTLEIGFAPPVATVVVHTPARGFCVEPQTAWPDAPALAGRGVEGTGLAALRPGEALEAVTTWTWES